MTEIHDDTVRRDLSVFQEGIDLENYYAGGGREEVLSQVLGAVQDGVALIVLTGEEGSGKTMLCRMFEHRSPADWIPIFFPRTVDSFDDVVRRIAERLDLDGEYSGGGRHRKAALQEITTFLQNNSKTMVVIFDEAENIYLATLERIRKMLDRVSALGGRMHIIFSGRLTFIENYDQLSICEFERNDELHFTLPPLTREATAKYLRDGEKRAAGSGGEILFTKELVADIFQLSGGNFRAIKVLAKKVVEGRGEELFSGLLESDKEDGETAERKLGKKAVLQVFERSRVILSELSQRTREIFSKVVERGRVIVPEQVARAKGIVKPDNGCRKYLPWGAAGCLLVLLLFLGFSRDGQDSVKRITHENKKIDVEAVAVEDDSGQAVQQEEIVAETSTPAKEDQTTPDLAGDPARSASTESFDDEEQLFVEEPLAPEENEPAAVEEINDRSDQPAVEVESIVADGDQPAVEVEERVEITQPPPEKEVVELHPPAAMKRKPEGADGEQTPIIKLQPRREVSKVEATTARHGAEQLLQRRMEAGSQWFRGGKDNLYTVQLMVLASKSAEENLVRMLSQDRYRQQAGNFYILKQRRGAGNIFVFYGEYPSIARARLAQNSLPRFLRIDKPYAISIKGAVNKVR